MKNEMRGGRKRERLKKWEKDFRCLKNIFDLQSRADRWVCGSVESSQNNRGGRRR